MNQERVVELEINNDTMSEVSEAVSAVVDETVKLFDSLGKALVTTMQDVSNLMVIQVDAETREDLDLLVDAGVAKSRSKAAGQMIKEGVGVSGETFDKIRRTKSQITELRQQLRGLVEGEA